MHESVEDRIGDRAVTEVRVPLIDRQLARDERRAAVVAVVEDLEQIAHGIGAERCEAKVVDHDQIHLGELAVERGTFLQSGVTCEFLDESWQAEAAHGEVRATGGMRERGGDVTLADTGRPGDQEVEVLA